MKNNKFARISILVLMLALCVGATFAMNISAEEPVADTATTPKIISQNVAYQGDFALMYAVDAATATGPVELYVYVEEPDADTPYTYKFTSTAITTGEDSGLGTDAYIFRTNGVPAAEMTKEFYVQAIDANGKKSEVKRYSVAEYLYQRLANPKSTEDQKELYNNVIKFGDNAQLVLAPNGTTPTLISTYRYVTIDGGTIDGYNAGVYPIGTILSPKVAGAISAKWNVKTTNIEGNITTDVLNGKFTVADATITELNVNSVVSYRAEVNNLDNYNPGDKFAFWAANNGGVADYEYVDGRGTVAKVGLDANGYCVVFTSLSTAVATKEEATAVEFSFDLKMVTPGGLSDTTEYIEADMCVGTDVIHRNCFYDGANSSGSQGTVKTNDLWVCSHNATWSSGYKVFEGVDPTDWFHVRVVYYAGDSNCYVYINGQDEPAKITSKTLSSYDGDITKIARAQIMTRAEAAGSTIYFDNLFFGYTKDTLPAVTE